MPFHDIPQQGPKKKDWTDYLTPALTVGGGVVGGIYGGPAGAALGAGAGQAVGGLISPYIGGNADVNAGLNTALKGYAAKTAEDAIREGNKKGDFELGMFNPTPPTQVPSINTGTTQLPAPFQPTPPPMTLADFQRQTSNPAVAANAYDLYTNPKRTIR